MKSYLSIILAAIAGAAVAFLPLVGYLHFESAFLAALVGSFLAVWQAIENKDEQGHLFRLLRVIFWVYLAALPLLIKDLAMGCFSVDGLGFWIFLPAPSIFFAFSLTRLFTFFDIGRSRMIALSILMLIGFAGFLVEFYTLPQVRFYNHLWGYWPGPVYDEAIHLGGSLIFYRTLTFCWGLLFWFLPHISASKSARWIFGLAAVALLLGYLNLSEMGIVRPAAVIQQKLGSTDSTDTIQLHFPSSHISRKTADYWSLRHEYYYEKISDTLQLKRKSDSGPIHSYIYAHPWQKKRIVGAKFTSYVPVWLNEDQLHIAYPQLSSSLHHELVHIAAKPFGNWMINASWSIGMVEGLAVALAQNSSSVSTVDQLVAAKKPYPSTEQIRNSLSFFGFYGGRQAVSYTTSGSFIAYLLRNYDVSRFKQTYRTADISSHYPVSFDSLVTGWHQHLATVSTDSLDRSRRSSLFSIPSIFEQECPHVLSSSEVTWDQYRYLLAEKDTARAKKLLSHACSDSCDNLKLWSEWTRYQLQQGNPDRVLKDTAALSPRLLNSPIASLRIADAHFLKGDSQQALRWLQRSKPGDNAIGKLQLQRIKKLRSDSMQWRRTVSLLYEHKDYAGEFEDQPDVLKALVIRQWMERNQWEKVQKHAKAVDTSDIHPLDFEIFVRAARRMIFLQSNSVSVDDFLDTLQKAAKRPRHRQMIQQLMRWKAFMSEH